MSRHKRSRNVRSSSLSQLDLRLKAEEYHKEYYSIMDNNDNDIYNTPSLFVQKMNIRYNEDISRSATYSEIFFDLVYVLVLQQLFIETTFTFVGILKYIGVFAITWNSWNGVAFFCTRFDTDDVFARMHIVFTMVGVVGMSVGIHNDDMVGVTASYGLIRLILVLQYIRAYISLPNIRAVTLRFIIGFGFGAIFWIIGALIAKHNLSIAICCWSIGFILGYATPFAMLNIMIPFHAGHMSERNGGFSVLACAAVVFNFPSFTHTQTIQFSFHHFVCSIIGLSIPYCINILYSVLDGPNMTNYTQSYLNKVRAYMWIYLHCPLLASIVLGAVAIGHLDVQNNHVHNVTPLKVLYYSMVCTHILLSVLHVFSCDNIVCPRIYRFYVRFIYAIILLICSIILPIHCYSFTCLVVLLTILGSECIIDSIIPSLLKTL